MINIILFSRDRACQLELLLRSMKLLFKEYKEHQINVLYTYSNQNFENGYNILMEEYSEVNFIKENNFKEDVMKLIDVNNKYTVFFVDDIIFKEKFTLKCKQIEIFSNDDSFACLSLRLHTQLNYCYTMNVSMKSPNMDSNGIFNWRGTDADFNYTMSLDGHIFKTDMILNLMKDIEFCNPNSLEGSLACRPPYDKPLMICFQKSVIFNNPINKVQTNNPNRHGFIDAYYLNDMFLSGKRIKLEPYLGLQNISCHQEMPIQF